MIIAFLIGGFVGVVIMSIFSARAYEKGYKDASNLYEMLLNENQKSQEESK